MKIAPLMRALENHSTIAPIIVHTGQHYDENMSELFFRDLDIPEPDINLEVGSASHAVQTARIMERFEKVCLDVQPDMVMVVGDVNSTAACTLVASKLNVTTAHYEAGLRSNDRTMPEEINRIVTDAICDYFFTTSKDASENLMREGKAADSIFLVDNLMIDTLIRLQELAADVRRLTQIFPLITDKHSRYALVTLHRPSNVDEPEMLMTIMKTLEDVSKDVQVIFPVYPRTRMRIQKSQYEINNSQFHLIDPVGYIEFLALQKKATVVITDSGGIQEETTVLGVPCLTLRENTERPITVWEGTNKLVGINEIEHEVDEILDGKGKKGRIPELWDGKAAERIIEIILNSQF